MIAGFAAIVALCFTPGLFARIRMEGTGRHDAVLIDDRAVGTDQDKKFVLVVGSDNTGPALISFLITLFGFGINMCIAFTISHLYCEPTSFASFQPRANSETGST